eukprot:scaffold647869_cov43-Prasinocladus_malaysianus.AAC.2
MGLDVVHGGAWALDLLKHHATLLIEGGVDASQGLLGSLDLHQVHRLRQPGLGRELGSVNRPAAGRDDLTTAAMDGIGVHDNIVDLIRAATHVLLSQDALLGGPLEGGHARVLDLVHELDALGDV